MAVTNLVQGDNKPSLYFTVTDETGTPIDISTYTLNFYFTDLETGTVINTGHTLCTITDGANGVCRYDWGNDDLDTEGAYEGELEITYPDTSIQTIYKKFIFNVRNELGP